jgi:hypothetical protein
MRRNAQSSELPTTGRAEDIGKFAKSYLIGQSRAIEPWSSAPTVGYPDRSVGESGTESARITRILLISHDGVSIALLKVVVSFIGKEVDRYGR